MPAAPITCVAIEVAPKTGSALRSASRNGIGLLLTLSIAGAGTALLGGCGQRGPLYLPADKLPKQNVLRIDSSLGADQAPEATSDARTDTATDKQATDNGKLSPIPSSIPK
ncbi:MAG: lipoprotein [Burkholderiaceae bacterium]